MSLNNGIISAPVSIDDVKSVLGESSNDLATLCKSGNVNPWAKYGATSHPSNFGVGTLNSDKKSWTLATSGGTINGWWLKTFDFKSIGGNISSWEGLMSAAGNTWKRNLPMGGATSPFRLGDFAGYNSKASCPIRVSVSNHLAYGGSFDVFAELVKDYADANGDDTNAELNYQDLKRCVTFVGVGEGSYISSEGTNLYLGVAWRISRYDNVMYTGAYSSKYPLYHASKDEPCDSSISIHVDNTSIPSTDDEDTNEANIGIGYKLNIYDIVEFVPFVTITPGITSRKELFNSTLIIPLSMEENNYRKFVYKQASEDDGAEGVKIRYRFSSSLSISNLGKTYYVRDDDGNIFTTSKFIEKYIITRKIIPNVGGNTSYSSFIVNSVTIWLKGAGSVSNHPLLYVNKMVGTTTGTFDLVAEQIPAQTVNSDTYPIGSVKLYETLENAKNESNGISISGVPIYDSVAYDDTLTNDGVSGSFTNKRDLELSIQVTIGDYNKKYQLICEDKSNIVKI